MPPFGEAAPGLVPPSHRLSSRPPALSRPSVGSLAFLLGATVVPGSLLLESLVGLTAGFWLTSLATTVLGVGIFQVHGGSRVTATGCFFLATATFSGIAGLLLVAYGNRFTTHDFRAALIVFTTTLLTFGILLARKAFQPARDGAVAPEAEPLPGRSTRAIAAIGIALAIFALVLRVSPVATGPLPPETAYVGALVVVAVLLARSSRVRGPRQVTYLALVGLALLAYVVVFFSGYGRLNLATLGLAVMILLSHRTPRGRVKVVALVGLLPFLIVAGTIGASRGPYGAPTRPSYDVGFSRDVLIEGGGLESVLSPVRNFASLLRVDEDDLHGGERVGRADGSTFLVGLVFWVPREIWADKPFGFGREVGILLTPYDDGHSEAATGVSEWYYNFGYLGLGAMVVLHALVLSRLDAWLARVAVHRQESTRSFLRYVLVIVLAAGLADYAWMGFFTYNTRAGLRALLLGALIVALAAVQTSVARRRPHRSLAPVRA